MTPRNAEVGEQSDRIVGKLTNRVTVIRLAAVTRASEVENDGPVTPAELRYYCDFPGIARPPRRWNEEHGFALAILLIIDFDLATLCLGHLHLMANDS
jgi:hypothetical protein